MTDIRRMPCFLTGEQAGIKIIVKSKIKNPFRALRTVWVLKKHVNNIVSEPIQKSIGLAIHFQRTGRQISPAEICGTASRTD